jgi:GTP pyrophosphokinase
VIIPGGTPCEVQIRTHEMHEVAERGIAAHWRYKEGFSKKSDKSFETKLAWLRSLIEWRRDVTDAREFVESLKNDVFEDQVYVFTPRGKIIDLPVESTPVDFAYRIHSELGNRCIGARVNSRLVSLDHQLRNGDIVHIMSGKTMRGPSRDWLNFVKTSTARSHIRRYFRRLQRGENIAAGRDLIEKELKRLGVTVSFDDLAAANDYRQIDDLFLHVGTGDLTARQAVHRAITEENAPTHDLAHIPEIAPPPRPPASGIKVRGTGDVLTRLAKCCNPLPGEPITGYVTRGRGVTVHRVDCRTILHERDRSRLVEVSWGDSDPQGYPVPVRVESWDRVGLWRDVSAIVADAGINIEELQQIPVSSDSRSVLVMRLTIHSLSQLTKVLDKLNRIPNVIEARRETNANGGPLNFDTTDTA